MLSVLKCVFYLFCLLAEHLFYFLKFISIILRTALFFIYLLVESHLHHFLKSLLINIPTAPRRGIVNSTSYGAPLGDFLPRCKCERGLILHLKLGCGL